jgi:hypothetical protein
MNDELVWANNHSAIVEHARLRIATAQLVAIHKVASIFFNLKKTFLYINE